MRIGKFEKVVSAEIFPAKFYDDLDDEAPLYAGSPFDAPNWMGAWVLVEDEDDEEPTRVYLLGWTVEELLDALDELGGEPFATLAEDIRAILRGDGGEHNFALAPEVEFLPPDWEKYFQWGCDTDGGNYCTFYAPVRYTNSKGEEQYYLASWSSCELGEPVAVAELDGRLCVVEERELPKGARVVYRPWHPDFTLWGPMSLEELIEKWIRLRLEEVEEREAYEEWVSRRFG